jgi:hypothetical protein
MWPSSLSTASLASAIFCLKLFGAILPIVGGILVLISLIYDRELRVRQQPRQLSPEQVERFRTVLREVPGRFISVVSRLVDREEDMLAEQLVSILRSEGWEADSNRDPAWFMPAIEGIVISARSLDSVQPHVSILQRAFAAVGMPARIEVDEDQLDIVEIRVGHKPSR